MGKNGFIHVHITSFRTYAFASTISESDKKKKKIYYKLSSLLMNDGAKRSSIHQSHSSYRVHGYSILIEGKFLKRKL